MGRRRRQLGAAATCRLPADLVTQPCATERGLTLCVGDRVERIKVKNRGGVVVAIHPGADNRGRRAMAARVCLDLDEPGDLAYPYLFSELRKPRTR
jgi:phytoene dehydrogenase-like protein